MRNRNRPFSVPKTNAEDDLAIWRAVTKTVTAYHRDTPQKTRRQIDTVQKTAPKEDRLKSRALRSTQKTEQKGKALVVGGKPFTQPADFREGDYAGIDKSNARRLRQGRAEIEGIIDLHGMTQAEALAKLRQFVQRAALAGKRTILVITGKGRAGQGVLRARVPEWLKEQPLSQLVIAISDAQPVDGGTGALYVRLRRKARQ